MLLSCSLSRKSVLAAGLGILILSGCTTDTKTEDYLNVPPNERIHLATQALASGNPGTVASILTDFERQHAFSPELPEAQILLSLSLYLDRKLDQSIITSERLIRLFPGHRLNAAASYLIAQAYYIQIVDPSRDQTAASDAAAAFRNVIARYPDSRFASASRLKLDAVQDLLAAKEMYVGRWYLERKKYLAAINRFKVIVDQYETTNQIEEALLRLSETYMALGLTEQSIRYASILGHNYPGSAWYRDAYKMLKPYTDKSGKLLK